MGKSKVVFYLFIVMVFFMWQAADIYAAENYLEKGIAEFNAENYEESVVLFEKAYKENPKDPKITFYLGRSHSEVQNYGEAVRFFRETLNLDPKAADPKFFLAEALYNSGNQEEALQTVEGAIRDGVRPSQSYYLKGQILLKMKKNSEAVEAFSKAKQLDPSLGQQADFQIATAYAQGKEFKKAEDVFRGLITADPNSDWALFSKDYLNAIERAVPSYRLNLGVGFQYDDNVLAIPIVQGIVDVERQEDWKKIFSLFGEYTFYSRGPWNMKGAYSLNITQHNESDYPRTTPGQRVFSLDTVSNTISLAPSYNTEKSSTGLLLSYSSLEVDYSGYIQTFTVSPSHTFVIKGDHLGQVFIRYRKVEHDFDWVRKKLGSSSVQEEDRDANNFSAGAGYFYLFSGNKGLVNINLEAEDNNADGANWDYVAIKTSAGILYPFFDNRLKASLFADLYYQDFSHDNTLFGNERRDATYTVQAALTYAIIRQMDISLGYAHVRDDSNIGVYDFRKNLYTVNVEYRF